jgi:hypothetical protein
MTPLVSICFFNVNKINLTTLGLRIKTAEQAVAYHVPSLGLTKPFLRSVKRMS